MAARKAGLPEDDMSVKSGKTWRTWLRLGGMAMQVIVFILLVIELFRIIETDFTGIEQGQIVAYLVVFFTGRVLQMIAGSSRP